MIPAAVVVCLATAAEAETYYVAPGGDDGAAGSEAAPWRTLQHAADRVQAGDVVRVRPGAYAAFQLSTTGRSGAEIAFVAEDGATISGGTDGINLEGTEDERIQYVRIEGFSVTGAERAGIRAVWCQHVTFRGNRADQNGRWGIFTGFCDDLLIERNETSRSTIEHGIYVSNSGDRPVIRGNTAWGNNRAGIHMNGDIEIQPGDGVITGALVEANVVYDNGVDGGSGINCDGVEDSVFRNNLLYDNHASGISLFREDGGRPSSRNLVVNNTIAMASDARWALNIQNASIDNVILNNVLLHAGPRGAIDLCPDCRAGTRSDYNVVTDRLTPDGDSFLSLADWRRMTSLDTNSRAAGAAQIFRVAAGAVPADFDLSESSVAIDHGTSDRAPDVDLAGNGRPQGAGVDVGAYEHCEGGDCKQPPPLPDRPDAGPPGAPDAGPGPGVDPDGSVTGGCCEGASGGQGIANLVLVAMGLALRARVRRRRAVR
jgi:parallel beta-helix repeat protein